MREILSNELKVNLKKKSVRSIFFITELICILWIIINFKRANNIFLQGGSYEDSGLYMFELDKLFYNYMLNLTTSVYIFPFIILGVILVADDIFGKVSTNLYMVSKNLKKYIAGKLITLLILNVILLALIFITCGLASYLMSNVKKVSLGNLINIYGIWSFLLYLFGISTLGFFSMGIAYYFRSSMAGALVAIYILVERIFTSVTAISLQNPYLMKFNEYLPWCNFNTLFVYGSNLKYLTSNLSTEELSNQAGLLTMFKIMKYNNVEVACPFFKDLWLIILICLLYLALSLKIFSSGVKKSIREG